MSVLICKVVKDQVKGSAYYEVTKKDKTLKPVTLAELSDAEFAGITL